MRTGVQAHDPLGDLAALHRSDRREGQLAAYITGGVDVRCARDTVVVDRDVPAVVDRHPGSVEVEPVRVGHGTDRQHGVRGAHDTAVVTAHDDDVVLVVSFDRRRPGALEQPHTAAQKVRFEDGGDLGILRRQHLLARHHERDLGAERREHVHELDPGDARADDRDATRELLGRVAVAGREDAITIGFAPLRNARPRTGGDEGDVEVDDLGPVDGVDLGGVR